MSDETRTFKPRFRCDRGHLHGVDGDGREAHLEAAEDGKPIDLEPGVDLVSAERLPNGDYQLRTLRKGPARANSAKYREGYDAIFGKQPRGQA